MRVLNVMAEACIVVCSLIYAFIISIIDNVSIIIPVLVLSLFLKRLPPLKLNLVNIVMLVTLALTYKNFRDGIFKGIIIAIRVNIIYMWFARFVFPLGVSGIYKALVTLRIPEKLRVLIILTLRGIYILRERFDRALISLKLRAHDFQEQSQQTGSGNTHLPQAGRGLRVMMKMKTFAYVTGGVLLQSSERSERMLNAIKLRGGFGGFIQ